MKRLFLALSLLVIISEVSFSQTKNLVIVTTDGFRWQEMFRGADSAKIFPKRWFGMDSALKIQMYWGKDQVLRREKLLPFFWNYVAKHGQVYGNRDLGNKMNVTNRFWVSHAGYNEIFTGYADSVTTNGSGPNPNISLLEVVNKLPGYKDKVAVFASWDEYYDIFNVKRSGLYVNAGWAKMKDPAIGEIQDLLNFQQELLPKPFGPTERLDASTYPLAKLHMKQHKPRVFYLALIDTDATAHRGEYDYYLNSAHGFDKILEDLWGYIQSDPFYKDQTTLLITTDHGRGRGKEWTSHHNTFPNSDEIWFAVMGPETPPLGEVKKNQQLYQNQLAQTMAEILGIKFTGKDPKGAPVPGVLKGR